MCEGLNFVVFTCLLVYFFLLSFLMRLTFFAKVKKFCQTLTANAGYLLMKLPLEYDFRNY